MPTDLEIALQSGGKVQKKTDLDNALAAGGQVSDLPQESGALAFVNRAIVGTLGAPVELATAGLNLIPGVDIEEPLAGSESITRGFKALGIETALPSERPETLAQQIGAGVGEGVSMLLPFTKAAQLASKGVGTVGRVSKVISEGILKHPIVTAATEVTAGLGTGVGRELAETTERPELRTTFELGGSLIGGFAPTALTFTPVMIGKRVGKTALKRISLPFTEAGSKFRAGQFIKGQVVDPSQVAEKVTAETIGSLPPAVASGEERLMGLFNQLRNADPVTDADAIKKVSGSIFKLEQELRKSGFAAPEILQNATKKRVASIQLAMDKRVADAVEIADDKLSRLPVAKRQSQESVFVRNELEKVRTAESQLVNEAWAEVPKDVVVEPLATRQAFADLMRDTPKAQRDDIPAVLKRSFVVRKGIPRDLSGLSLPKRRGVRPVTIRETQGLRSKLLEVQRIARKDGKWNKARIAGDMADNLLEDMSKEGISEPLKVAIAATRKFKSRFEGGIVGRLMGHSKTGAPSISPELTLDVSIGRSGIAGSVDIDRVAVTPEARSAVRRFLGRSFSDFATTKGTKDFNVDRATKWIANNQEVLDQFPELRTQLEDVNTARQFATDTLATMTARRKRIEDPRISLAARFINAEPSKEIDSIFKTRNPVAATKDLVNKANNDASGEALEGLRGAYVDFILDKSSIGPYNELGEQTISGKKLLSFLGENNSALQEILPPEKIARMRKVGDELLKLELSEKGKLPHVAIELEDTASSGLRMMSRVGGAQFGRWVAGITGGGTIQTPGIFSERFQNFAKGLTKDRAFQLIHEAVTADDGGKLLKSLLLPIDKPTTPKGQSNLRELNRRVSTWLIGTGSRIIRDIEEEQNEDQEARKQKIAEQDQRSPSEGNVIVDVNPQSGTERQITGQQEVR